MIVPGAQTRPSDVERSYDAIGEDDHVSILHGVGVKRAAVLKDAGIENVGQMLLHLPIRYEDRCRHRPVNPNDDGLKVLCRVRMTGEGQLRRAGRGGRFRVVSVAAEDEKRTPLVLKWFNQPYMALSLEKNGHYLCYGLLRVESSDAGGKSPVLIIEQPEILKIDGSDDLLSKTSIGNDKVISPHMGRIVPIYQRIQSVSGKQIRTLIHQILIVRRISFNEDKTMNRILLDQGFGQRSRLRHGIHFPAPNTSIKSLNTGKSLYHRGLAFEEIYRVQWTLALKKQRRLKIVQCEKGRPSIFESPNAQLSDLQHFFPFRLTAGQNKAILEIIQDMYAPHPMRRLLQGEVGCGKTAVAYAALLTAAGEGRQTALMVPTEALAWQHWKRLCQLLKVQNQTSEQSIDDGMVGLLTAALKTTERRRLIRGVRSGKTRIVIGTHSIISPDVIFRNLGLVVVDEQHRFGVEQRESLHNKGNTPDVLIISATPIPRTMGLWLTGDMDMTRITDLPRGKRNVKTVCLEKPEWGRGTDILQRELSLGRQGFVVCPRILQNSGTTGAAVESVYHRISSGPLSRYGVDLLHGRMDPRQMRLVLEKFERGETRLLVTTSVVEVGLDVETATVMVVLEPLRFGLSQLHQLRGRIGRGRWPGWFILCRSTVDKKCEINDRLDVLVSSDDGYLIAEEDFRMRGTGDLTGTRQAGSPRYRAADLQRDADLLLQARNTAFHNAGLMNDE